MSLLDVHPQYRITASDLADAWNIYGDEEKYESLSDAEKSVVYVFIQAGYMYHKSGVWPTIAEVEEHLEREEANRQKQHEEREAHHAEIVKLWNQAHGKQ